MKRLSGKHYMGIDPSINGTGMVVVDSSYNIVEQEVITSSASTMEQKMWEIGLDLTRVIDHYVPNCIAMEDLAIYGIGQRLLQLAGLNYHLRILMLERCAHFVMVSPTALKKFVCGTSKNIKKQQMLLETYIRWKVKFVDDNICDAYGLSRMAVEMMSSIKRTRQPKRN
jgi:Holliday junction resolvasome RuvABC endonuclease subunit